MLRLLACLALLNLTSLAEANLKLPSVFGDHMVLQRDIEIPVWGWGDPGDKIKVSLRDQTAETTVGENGKWRVNLKPEAVGKPATLEVSDGEASVVFEDVLLGEVWVCSGQSNMGWTVQASIDPDLEAAAADYPEIRLFQVPLVTAAEPQEDVNASWRVCQPDNISNFTGVGYYFGRQLYQVLGIPVGLIQTAWGGTRAEAWTSPEAMASTEELKPIVDTWEQRAATYDPEKAEQAFQAALKRWEENGKQGRRPQKQDDPNVDRHCYSRLYNAMVSPLVPYAIRGAIWYQGESNASRAYQYRTLMPTMIQSWRDAWDQGDFSFYQVQLANFRNIVDEPADSDWAELREAQHIATEKLPNVGAACITDLGAALDIHPKDKQNVGKRLARLALHNDYGMENITPMGPTYKDMEVKDGQAHVHFDTYGRQLVTYYREPLTGFQICGEDKNWVWGNAKIVGKDTVVVSHPDVPNPVAVRYNWANNPQGTLYSDLYLPAYPFRTDNWEGVTANNVTP